MTRATFSKNEFEQRLEQFDQDWQHNPPPAIDGFLPSPDAETVTGYGRRELLVELIIIDLECRWRRRLPGAGSATSGPDTGGEPTGDALPDGPSLEEYLKRYPELGPAAELSVELVAHEYRIRNRWGDQPRHEVYFNRFPQLLNSLPSALMEIDRQLGNTPRNSAAEIDTDDLSTVNRGNTPATVDAKVPDSIGRYRVVRLLGRGGFGLVYLARDDELDRRVAIKVPHAAFLSSAEVADMYIAEARAAANLDHPNVVPVYDVGATDTVPCFIVSKFIEGTDLATTIKEHQLSHPQVALITATIAEALHYAHTQGVVHRDIKPANILIDKRRKPYIVDFGLALRDQDLSQGPRYAGTPSYMSPEQARGEGHRVDGRSDIFSLGVVLYEMLVGRRPFIGDTPAEVMEQVVSHEPKPLRQLNDSLPRKLERICFRAVSKPASQRYLTAKEMADDLWDFLESQTADTSSASGETRAREDTPLTTADSDSRPIKVIPKGLRSFDTHDADFFLELLPGPRDREGLPDSLRFWKSRIEETDPDHTFSVGVIYGPSGCGKSSLVRAGLLPRLSDDVLSIYIEAAGDETETRLLHGLRKRCPALGHNLSLKDTMAALRRGQGVPTGRKVLIVLDQFEQWLHAKKEEEHTDLIQALRQCDGGRVQCIVMVRDDFWMAVSRFMRALEVRLVEAGNSAAVDLFPIRHAEKVLAAFGRAFEALPDNIGQTSQEQKDFLKQSVAGLSEEGKVICVRLSLFAEMLKGKSWTPATLKEVGGATGIGVTFLEETFSASTAPPEHRYHQKAARAVLKALLPESGTDIKGEMKSYDELLQASSYARRPQDFDDLIRILNGEIRLITPTDPVGVEIDDDSIAQADIGQKCFQLTHDYLVPSLRDWLTRKQKETRKGRAELLLADRSAVWNARPDNRQLPSLLQWLQIRWFTEKKNWMPPQRKMMARAGRLHGFHWGTALLLTLIIGVTIQQIVAAARLEHLSEQIATTVSSLNTNRGIILPPLKDLNEFPRELVLAELRKQFETADLARRLPLAYALAHSGDVRTDFLVSQVEAASANEVDNLVAALDSSRVETVSALKRAARTAERKQNWRHKARLAMLALHLEAPSLAQEMCRLRPDPIQRTLFIEECSTWHGNLTTLAQLMADSDDGPFRSGVVLVFGSVSDSEVSQSDNQAWLPVLTNWSRNERDTVTHSAAAWALQKRKQHVPEITTSKAPTVGMNWHVNGLGMTMLKIPAGSFVRRDSRFQATIDQTVTLTRTLLLADREVTRAQFQQFIDDPDCPDAEKPKGWPGATTEYSPTELHPVQMVNWYDAVLFCNWLSRKESLTPCYERTGEQETVRGQEFDAWRLVLAASGYRLPTEGEWEYACRAGSFTTFCYGDDESLLDRYAVCLSSRTELSGSKLPNGWGLFDMHGNVSEWCHDWFGPFGNQAMVNTPKGPDRGILRVLRGGSFSNLAFVARSSYRLGTAPGNPRVNDGFRVARTLRPLNRPTTPASITSNSQAAPVLLRPLPNVMLSNGSVVDRSKNMVWTFEWQAVPNASHYHLFVIGGGATIPMIDLDTIPTTRYQYTKGGFILEKFLKGWRWKVRANVNGAWGEWTEYRTFDVKPPKR